MDFLTTIEDNTILIIPNNIKEKVLTYIEEQSLLLNIKIMSFNDLKKGIMFDYTNEAIYEVMNVYQLNYGVAKNYIRDLYYIDEQNCTDEKWQFLKKMKDELEDKHLLIHDELFGNFLRTKKKIYVYGFDYLTKFNDYLLQKAQKYIPVVKMAKGDKPVTKEVLVFETMDDEITYIAEEILKLVNKGVDLNKIYIANYDDEYFFTMRRIFSAYHIPYYIRSETTLYKTAIGKYFLNNLGNNRDALLYKIRKQFDVDNNPLNDRVCTKLNNLLNTYYWCDNLESIRELIQEEMNNITIPSDHFDHEVRTTDYLNNIFDTDEYVFLIGFNLGSIPKTKRDEDYINDAIKPPFLETSLEYNQMLKQATIHALSNIPNLTISYKKVSSFNSYYPSFLIDGEHFSKREEKLAFSHYANDINELLLAQDLDNYNKFGEISSSLPILNNSYNIPYRTYDNAFTGINKDTYLKTIDDKLVFSYSNISKYYECPFKFFISSILKINFFEETIDQFIGSLFHDCLEKALDNPEINIDEVYDAFIAKTKKEKKMTNKEHFFMEQLREEMKFIIMVIREQNTHSQITNTHKEETITIDIVRQEVKTKLKGVVDKLLVFDNEAMIVDYKTGSSQDINLDYLEFGISLQLPIYLYLLKNCPKYADLTVIGLYIQHILNFKINQNDKKDYEQSKADTLKLIGVTFDDAKHLRSFDDSYEDSKVIYGLKLDKDGNLKLGNHILCGNRRDELLESVQKLIFDCIDEVIAGTFKIAPLKIAKKVDGCKFCDYKDICYRTAKDYNYQQVKKKEGEDNEYLDA